MVIEIMGSIKTVLTQTIIPRFHHLIAIHFRLSMSWYGEKKNTPWIVFFCKLFERQDGHGIVATLFFVALDSLI